MRTTLLTACVLVLAGCGGGPPRHTSRPDAAAPGRGPAAPGSGETRPFGDGVDVRVGLHWQRGTFEVSSRGGLRLRTADGRTLSFAGGERLVASAGAGADVRVKDASGRTLIEEAGPLRIEGTRDGDVRAGGRRVRGSLRLSARADSLFAVNVVALEDYLRGVVPREIGARPAEEREAVAAQAVAARTYTVKRLGQYGSLPFDVYASVQDQVYEGADGENPVADRAIRETRGLVLADARGLIEAYYSSTCGGQRSDIRAVWPHREAFASLRGGPDGSPGREWCSFSPHFAWTETWDGAQLSALVRENLPAMLEMSPGTVQGDLIDLRVTERGPSGRIAALEYETTGGRWTVPGDRNRWILRRPDGKILRSVLVELEVERREGRVVRLTARGRGNGHGVGMCQMGAIGRARAGESFRDILAAYYPGTSVRSTRGSDLPPGRPGAS